MPVTTQTRHKGNFVCRACGHRYNPVCPQHKLRWSCCNSGIASSVFCEPISKPDPKAPKRLDVKNRKPWVTPYEGVDDHEKKRKSTARTLPKDKSARSFNKKELSRIHATDKNRRDRKVEKAEAEYWEKLSRAHNESDKWDR